MTEAELASFNDLTKAVDNMKATISAEEELRKEEITKSMDSGENSNSSAENRAMKLNESDIESKENKEVRAFADFIKATCFF